MAIRNNRSPRIFLTDSLEGFILTAILFVTFLSLVFGLFGIPVSQVDTSVAAPVAFNILNKITIQTFVPPIIGTRINLGMMIVAPLLSIFGFYALSSQKHKLIKYWLMLLIPFWAVQTVALVALGFYPLGAGYTALFLGATIFTFSERLHKLGS